MAHLNPSLAKGLKNEQRLEMNKNLSSKPWFTNSNEVKLMKIEYQVFSGIFYNLDA